MGGSGEGEREGGRACRGPCGAGRGGTSPELGDEIWELGLETWDGLEGGTERWVGTGGRLENEGAGDAGLEGPALPPTWLVVEGSSS